jgi:cytochrome o ubiquinol oxidase subunit 1
MMLRWAGNGLFIVSAMWSCYHCLGAFFQVLQIVVSFIQRKENMDTTGDPWNGRTLEWSTSSPVPFYNFAVIPEVHEPRCMVGYETLAFRNAKKSY